MDNRLLEAVAVTAELTGTDFTKAAARVFAQDLARYPLPQVLGALERCRRELSKRMVLADVISRLDDGRPGAEEAWAMVPKSEAESVVWNNEICEAYGVAAPLLDGDAIAARMAFKETYTAVVARARDRGEQPQWWPSYGRDRSGRALAVRQAAERNRIPRERALQMLEVIGPEYANQHRAALEGPTHIETFLPALVGRSGGA